MNSIRTWLQGKKTYMTAVAAVVAAFIAFGNEAMTPEQFVSAIVAAILACTIGAKIDRAK